MYTRGKNRWHSYHGTGLYKPCINQPFGDCAMYFDFGVGKYADITCILRNPHRYRKWRPVFGWGHLLCHEAKQIPLLRPLSCNNKTKNLGTCWFSTGRNKSPVFFLFHTFVSSILRKMIKPPKKEHESTSITIYFGMCFRIIYMYSF